MSEETAHRIVVADRYRLERRLARGGMATVHLAHDEVLDRPVALKIMLARLAQDETFVARFQREAQSAAKLNHSNIVAVYDWGEHEDTYFIAMEYVEGETLAARLKSHGPLAPDEATRIAVDVAEALNCAHQQETVHRDIKPANILLSPAGSAKVTDFGIARAFDGDVDLTEVGKVLGTALYFSPEQARGERVGPPSDLYSLGVMLFEMLTGKPPFGGASTLDVALKHIENTPPLASSKRSSVPHHLDAIVDRLLAKDPADRYQAAADLIADLAETDGLRAAGRSSVGVDESVENGRTEREGTSGEEPRGVADDAAVTRVDGLADVDIGDPSTRILDPPSSSTTAATTAAMAVSTEDPRGQHDDGVDLAVGDEPPSGRSGLFMAAAVLVLIAIVALTVLVTQALTANSDSARAPMLVVPPVIGESEAAALATLRDAGFVAVVDPTPSDAAAPGIVIDQLPLGQTQAPEGSAVTIVVSAASETGRSQIETPPVTEAPSSTEAPEPELIELINVVGSEQAAAEQQLRDLGFEVVIQPVDVDPATETVGIVRTQNPPAGPQVARGATITLEVGRPPAPDEQPPTPEGETTTTVGVAPTSTVADSEPASPSTASDDAETTGEDSATQQRADDRSATEATATG